MIVQINIDTCDDQSNTKLFLQHWEEIKKQYLEKEEQINRAVVEGGCYDFDDSNCYGTHQVTICDR